MSNPIQTGDGVGFAVSGIKGMASWFKGDKKKKRQDEFSNSATVHKEVLEHAASESAKDREHEITMHNLREQSRQSALKDFGHDPSRDYSYEQTEKGIKYSSRGKSRGPKPTQAPAPKPAKRVSTPRKPKETPALTSKKSLPAKPKATAPIKPTTTPKGK